jgi:hypothetical protein
VNLIANLKELWRRRVLVAAAAAAAVAISVLAVFDVGVLPPSISKREHVDAKGSIEILIDSSRSPIADARRDVTGLTARAGVFARLMAGGNVVRRIARSVDVPVKQIDVAGPTPLPGQAAGVAQPPPQLHPYGISIEQAEELPIVTVNTRAPTVPEARAMAAAAPGAVRHMVKSIQEQQGTPTGKRVELRVLGPALAAPNDEALGKKVALALFAVLLIVSIVLILGIPRLIAAWRSAPDGLGPDDRTGGPGRVPEVLYLPAGPREEPDGGDGREATPIEQGEP